MMNYYALLPLIGLLFNVYLFAQVQALSSKREINRVFLLLIALIGGWIFCTYLTWQPLPDQVLVWIMRISIGFWLPTGFCFIYLSYVLVEKRKDVYFYFSLGLLLPGLIMGIFTGLIVGDIQHYFWGNIHLPGKFYHPILVLLALLPNLYSIGILRHYFFKTKNVQLKEQIRLILIGTVLTMFIGYVSDYVFPILLNHPGSIRLGSLGTIIFSAFIFMAVKKYNLFVSHIENASGSAIEGIREGVILVNPEKIILYLNQAAMNIFNISDKKNVHQTDIVSLIKGYEYDKNYENEEMVLADYQEKVVRVSQHPFQFNGLDSGKIVLVRDFTARRRIEKSLIKMEQRYELLVQHMNEGVARVDLYSRVEFVNDRFCELTGYSREELIGQRTLDLLLAEDADKQILREKLELRKRGIGDNYEIKIRKKSGEIRWFMVSGAPVYEDGGVVGSIGLSTDIQVRKQIEQDLLTSKADLERRVEERTRDLSLINTSLKNEIGIRQKAEAALHQSEDRLRVRLQFTALIAEIATAFINYPLEEIEKIFTFSLEKIGRFLEMDRSYLLIFRNEENQNKKTYSWSEKRWEEADDDEIAPTLLMPEGQDKEKLFPWWSLKLDEREIVFFSSEKDLPETAINEKKIFRKLGIRSMALLPLISSSKVIGYLGLETIQFEKQWSTGILGLLNIAGQMFAHAIERYNLSQSLEKTNQSLLLANQELKTLDELKTNLISNVSHELRTPLASVIGYSDLLLEGTAGPINEQQKSLLNVVMRNTKQLLSLIDNLLEFSKFQQGQAHLNLSEFDLIATAKESIAMAQPKAKKKGIVFSEDFNSSLIMVFADQLKISQIFMNVIDNAIKFTQSAGKIALTIQLHPEKPWVQVKIKDTGIGMPKDKIDKIFERFYQVDSSSTRLYGGTGIGLAICREIINIHRGNIYAVSETGQGATFVFEFPLRMEEKQKEPPPPREKSMASTAE